MIIALSRKSGSDCNGKSYCSSNCDNNHRRDAIYKQTHMQDLETLAKVGASGKHPNNCCRDLGSKLNQSKMPDPEPVSIPLRSTRKANNCVNT
jgi:hypothetical protein